MLPDRLAFNNRVADRLILYVQLLLSNTELKLKCELKSDRRSKSSYNLFCNMLVDSIRGSRELLIKLLDLEMVRGGDSEPRWSSHTSPHCS